METDQNLQKTKEELEFLRELVRDIQIEIMDGRLQDWGKLRNICTWCTEYEDKYQYHFNNLKKSPDRGLKSLLEAETEKYKILLSVIKRLEWYGPLNEEQKKEIDIAMLNCKSYDAVN